MLVDEAGNVIDKYGRVKMEYKHLAEDGNLPPCLTMDGRSIDLFDIVGEFDRDRSGNPVFLFDSEGRLTDRQGRLVNEHGYLLDEVGNVVDKNGVVAFEKRFLSADGEPPKLF